MKGCSTVGPAYLGLAQLRAIAPSRLRAIVIVKTYVTTLVVSGTYSFVLTISAIAAIATSTSSSVL